MNALLVRASTVWVEAVHLTIPLPLEGVCLVGAYVLLLALMVILARATHRTAPGPARSRAPHARPMNSSEWLLRIVRSPEYMVSDQLVRERFLARDRKVHDPDIYGDD